MFDMEMLNDALNMPRGVLSLFSLCLESFHSKERGRASFFLFLIFFLIPPIYLVSFVARRLSAHCPSNIYLSK